MNFKKWFCNNPTEKDLTEQCTCNWEIATIHLQWCKYWKMVNEDTKFKCEYCNKTEYKIENNIVISKCCNRKYSIDYLYLHIWKTLLHTR